VSGETPPKACYFGAGKILISENSPKFVCGIGFFSDESDKRKSFKIAIISLIAAISKMYS
jgi:hypothetical protein